MLLIGPKGESFLEVTKSSLARHNVPYETFGPEELKTKYPGLAYPSDYEYVLDKSGGILMADKMLSAFQVSPII